MKVNEVVEGTRCWKGYEKKGMKTQPKKSAPTALRENT